jgi:hypothetical protein
MTSTSHALLRFFRILHLYIGIFISPALFFFAFTGALQTFSLHETTQGSSYKPPKWIVTLAQIHKKQTTEVPARRARPAFAEGLGGIRGGGGQPAGQGDTVKAPVAPPQPKPKSHLPMKIFFLLVSLGLFTSTLTGMYMAYRYRRNKLVVTAVLVAGIAVPLVLLPL